jgi:hypothetical protein
MRMTCHLKGKERRGISSVLIAKRKERRIGLGNRMIGNIILRTQMEKNVNKGKEGKGK